MRFSAAVLILWGGAAFVDVHAFAPSTERAFVVASQRRTPPRAAVAFTAPTSSSSTQLNLFASVRPTTAVSSCGEHDPLNNRHSASDWLYNVRSFPQSKVLREIRNPVLTVAAWSFFVSVLHRVCKTSFPALAANMSIPGTAHSFLVSALGLLLVFRTNSAYQRFNVSRFATSTV